MKSSLFSKLLNKTTEENVIHLSEFDDHYYVFEVIEHGFFNLGRCKAYLRLEYGDDRVFRLEYRDKSGNPFINMRKMFAEEFAKDQTLLSLLDINDIKLLVSQFNFLKQKLQGVV